MTITLKQRNDIIENALTLIVVFAMYIYGLGKFFQFDDTSQNLTPVAQLTPMQLMWAFYGYSKPFALTLGLFEITGATLLLFKKTRLLGCFFTSSILVNVILQDIFFQVNFGALLAAIIYQSIIVFLLLKHKHVVVASIKTILLPYSSLKLNRSWAIQAAITLVLFIAFRIVEYYLTSGSMWQ